MANNVKHITALDIEIYNFIYDFIDRNLYPPVIRDIVLHCNVASTSAANFSLSKLKAVGLIDYQPNISRTITIIGQKNIMPPRATLRAGRAITPIRRVNHAIPKVKNFTDQ